MNDERPVLTRGYVGVNGKKICYTGEEPPKEQVRRVINGARRLLMPGLINSHSHLPMTLLRGYADDYRLQEWLFDHIFPAEGKLDERSVAAGARLGLAECIRFGVTSCTEMYFHLPEIARAVLESGAKANVSNAFLCLDMNTYDFEGNRSTRELREALAQFGGTGDGRLIIDAGIHAEYTSAPAAWHDSLALAEEHNLRFHIHLSETQAEHRECM
jgi:5-methylthioadenosine/S-adenosylhomocysteine deaminase